MKLFLNKLLRRISQKQRRNLYLFLDEGGNLDFSSHGILHDFDLSKVAEVIIITDQTPLAHRRQAVEKSIKQVLNEMLPLNINYRIFHHESKSNLDLQIADYCSWAVFRKWERDDLQFFRMIQNTIKSESKVELEKRQ